MSEKDDAVTMIGRAERIDLPKQGIFAVPAKIDTGADSSSIWSSNIKETPDGLQFTLFGPGSDFYTGETLLCKADEYEVTRVASSFGDREFRYKVKLTARIKGRLVRGSFTLADRSNKTYPILLGRRLLSGKFIVDVKAGEPLKKEERKKSRLLAKVLEKMRGKG